MRSIIIILAFVFNSAFAEELNVPGGEYTSIEVSGECAPCLFMTKIKIIKLNDADNRWAPSSGLVFHGANGELATIGIRKLEGKQGIVSFIEITTPTGNLNTLKAIETNLEIGKEYEINAAWQEGHESEFEVTGLEFSYDIGFKPVKAEFMISGMQVDVSHETSKPIVGIRRD